LHNAKPFLFLQLKDAIRQQNLEEAGFKVIRFTNEDVLKNIDWVRKEILQALETLKAAGGKPHPSTSGCPPLRRGTSNPVTLSSS
jgi:hypothetical protein